MEKWWKPDKRNGEIDSGLFGISMDELETGEIKTAPAEAGADDEMNEMLEEIRRRPELKTLFSLSSKATVEDVNTTIKIIQALRGGQSDE